MKSRRAAAPHSVRLIGGIWKRSKLPVADKPGLRPTPDRVRETLFNWLGQDLSGWHCLDAFAGSGALGFEAASRGAGFSLLLEHDGDLARSLRASAARLGASTVRVEVADALQWMAKAAPNQFDLVLLDPPFDSGLLERAIALAAPLARAGGFLYVESRAPVVSLAPGFERWRSGRAGAVHFGLLRRTG
jgi:16S rRNA (guanine(966)-N(2))-methyltransferase RsmD